jgi:hypothetical protein
VATSDERPSEPLRRYLVSRKHLVGTAGGLVGVTLALGGVAGPLWPVVVMGLYAAGALAAPSDRQPAEVVRQLLASAAQDAAALIEDLDRIDQCVRCAEAELPAAVPPLFEQIEQKLSALLAHPNVLAAPEVLHVISTTIRKDLDQIVGAYLALPAHLRHRPITMAGQTPDDELVLQLRLLDEYVSITSERVFSSHTRDIADLSEYLERRNRQAPSELEGGTRGT